MHCSWLWPLIVYMRLFQQQLNPATSVPPFWPRVLQPLLHTLDLVAEAAAGGGV